MTGRRSITVTAAVAGLTIIAGLVLVVAGAIMTGVPLLSPTGMAVAGLGIALEVLGYVLGGS
jgi:hypothetical protein